MWNINAATSAQGKGPTGKYIHQNSQLTQTHLAEGLPRSDPSWPPLTATARCEYVVFKVNSKAESIEPDTCSRL